jgi:hypothetical protein
MEFDILIPGQHSETAKKLVDFATTQFGTNSHRIAKELARSNYWEAYYCKDESRQEYWRVVLGCFDSIEEVLSDAPKTYTESEVREIVGRTWEAAIKWEWVENRNQERVDEGSTHWVNPCPDKETFINTLFPSGR